MRCGFLITTGDPRTQADLAAEAEAAGWDGVFTYDAIAIAGMATHDPWVLLAAMAMRTDRVTLGALVFAPTRRRPWKLAREALAVDHLSGGRLVLPVGLGATDDDAFGGVGEATDARTRAAILDETLSILDRLWTGERVTHAGQHFRIAGMTMQPAPVARPRIPIWVVGAWPAERSLGRAARWDGLVVQALDQERWAGDAPGVVREAAAWVARERAEQGRTGPFEIVVDGTTPAADPRAAADRVGAFADAGATWWIESDWSGLDVDAMRRRIAAGPPAGS